MTVLAVRPHGWRAGLTATGRRRRQADEAAMSLDERIRQVSSGSIGVQVVEGAVGQAIVRAARDHRADLLVMGARERGRLERLVFGSVTEHVLMRTSSPILIVPPRVGSPPSSPGTLFERMVCGVDRSPDSRRALAYALSVAGRHVAVVHALEDFSDEDPRFARHFNSVECWREVESDIRGDYENLIPEEARLWCDVEVVVPFGHAGSVLVEAAESRRATLVVIGTAGGHSPLGATARYVIQKAPCPVLAVPRADAPPARMRVTNAPTADL